MNRVGFLITARLKSTRLPVKLLAKIRNDEIVRHVIRRAKSVFGIDRIVLCTSTHQQDLPLIDIAHQEGIFYFAGSENDVLKRLGDAAHQFCLDSFVSITADNPLFCTYHANRVADVLRRDASVDYVHIDGLPIGTAVYGLSTSAAKAIEELKIDSDTEIWGPFVNRPEFFKIKKMQATDGFNIPARLTVDHAEDYYFMLKLSGYSSNEFYSLTIPEIQDILMENPGINKINSHIVQKGLSEDIQQAVDEFYEKNSKKIKAVIDKHKFGLRN